ncbi:hypothetical protein NQ317_001095 [Molorchus minor]|uniref:Gag protein n=3 Tax=Molorchus minor TaxID=1323400 RepID=A0ABQ9J5E3_9CUCU|nr:hypothetical protein NQ317_001095 [Molorchus minor]
MSLSDRLRRHQLQDANRNLDAIVEEQYHSDTIPNLDFVPELDINMALPERRTLDTNLLKLYLDTVPIFDGNSLVLHSYIDSVRNTFTNFPDDPHHVTHNLILQAVKNKLKNRAQNLIASRTDLTTWIEIERLLKLTFGDQRDLQYLTHQLTSIRPNRNERPYDFGLKLQELRAAIIAKINDDFPDIGLRNLQIQNYNDIAKTMFITNLPINVQTIIRMRNPNSLEDALNLVLEEEEFQNFAKLHQNRPVLASNNVSNSNNNNAMKPFKSFNQQNQQPFRNFSQQNNFRNYSQPQFDQQYSKPFPSAPINIQSRPVKQNFPTNRQVFGPQKNVWKPNHTSNQPRPTPMSGVSRFSQPRPTPMSGLSYVNNTETADRIPSYDREIYPYIQEFDNERLERITAHEENFEQQQQYYYEDSPESPEEDEELEDSNFQTTRSPQYPTYNLNPLEIRRLQFPVAIENGPIIIPEFQSEKFYIPEILTTSENYFAEVEVHNLTSSNQIVSFTEPQPAIAFDEEEYEIFN